MILISLSLLGISIACYSVSQSLNHGQFRWTDRGFPFSFWGKDSHVRKYKEFSREKGEAFKFSTTWLVFLTDGYHLMQFLSHLILAIAFGLLFEVNIFDWNGHIQAMIVTWLLIKGVHFAAYNTSTKNKSSNRA